MPSPLVTADPRLFFRIQRARFILTVQGEGDHVPNEVGVTRRHGLRAAAAAAIAVPLLTTAGPHSPLPPASTRAPWTS